LSSDDGKRAGELLGTTHASDVVDAHLVQLIAADDHVLTSDRADIGRLLRARRVAALLVRV
jgi:hypothetical protein